MLEDERLMVPVLHPKDYARAVDPRRFDGYRSAEVGRFMGYLLRQLRALGEALVFDTDPRDPRPGLLLEEFFRRLHDLGALRGAQPEEAFDVRPATTREDLIAFDIEIAPAFPLDRLHLTFFNRAGAWQARIAETGGANG